MDPKWTQKGSLFGPLFDPFLDQKGGHFLDPFLALSKRSGQNGSKLPYIVRPKSAQKGSARPGSYPGEL